MSQTISLQLPDETLQRYRRGAHAARKLLEDFLVERLSEALPPLAEDLPSPFHEELKRLEEFGDEALWEILRGQLPPARQRQYSRLLTKQHEGLLTTQQEEKLQALGDEARLLMLKKSHAAMLLQWRGHTLPSVGWHPPSDDIGT